MKHHLLKILPEYFVVVASGVKKFEIRKADRKFNVGDTVCLQEWNESYTGRSINVEIIYVTTFQQKQNYVVFGFDVLILRGLR